MAKPMKAIRRIVRGGCSETTNIKLDRQRQHRQMTADEVQPVIADSLGDRGARRQAHNTPNPISSPRAARLQRSTVHHQRATGL